MNGLIEFALGVVFGWCAYRLAISKQLEDLRQEKADIEALRRWKEEEESRNDRTLGSSQKD